MVDKEYGFDGLRASGRVGIVDCRYRRTVISKIKEEITDTLGSHGWKNRRITVADAFEKMAVPQRALYHNHEQTE